MPSKFICSFQSLSRVGLFATPWTAAHQASLSFSISQSWLRLMSIELVMPSKNSFYYPSYLLSLGPSSLAFHWGCKQKNYSYLTDRWGIGIQQGEISPLKWHKELEKLRLREGTGIAQQVFTEPSLLVGSPDALSASLLLLWKWIYLTSCHFL